MWSPHRQEGLTKIVGPAYTVQYAPKDDERPKWPSHYVSLALLRLSLKCNEG
jgi:regulator of RNase E activity RraA